MNMTYEVTTLRERWIPEIESIEFSLEGAREEVVKINNKIYEDRNRLFDAAKEMESMTKDEMKSLIEGLGLGGSFFVDTNVHGKPAINHIKQDKISRMIWYNDGSIWDATDKICGFSVRRIHAEIYKETEIVSAISLAKSAVQSIAKYVEFDCEELSALKSLGLEV